LKSNIPEKRRLIRLTTSVEKKRELGVIPVRPLISSYLFRDTPLLSVDTIMAIIQVLRSYELAI
jgi:hypothetical protein